MDRLRKLVTWYATPAGMIFGALIALLLVRPLVSDLDAWLTTVGLVGLAAFVPVKLLREQQWVTDRITSERRHSEATLRQADERRVDKAEFRGGLDELREDLRNHVAQVAVHSERASDLRLDELTHRLDGLSTASTEAQQRLADETEKRATRLAELDERLADVREATTRTHRHLLDMNRRTIARHARVAVLPPPAKHLLLVALPRSGSTWCFDMLRVIPSVHVDPSAATWERLGLDGRRYPGDLSSDLGTGLPIEVAPDVGTTIPFRHLNDAVPMSRRIAIEKFHPQFYGLSAVAAARRIEQLSSNGTPVQLLYVLREPLSAMWSMASYKKRQPSWYAHLSFEEIPRFIAENLESMAELHKLLPGRVQAYEQRSDDEWVELFRHVDPGLDREGASTLVRLAQGLTDRAARIEGQTGKFIAASPSIKGKDPLGPDACWREQQHHLADARAAYDELLRRQH